MSDTKHTPNPLPCGCAAFGIQDLENAVDDGSCLRVGYKNVHVRHCPLHEAAPDLFEAALKVIEGAESESWDRYHGTDEPRTGFAELRAAIAKATQPQETP